MGLSKLKRRRLKRLGTNLLLLFATVALVLLALEFGSRIVAPQEHFNLRGLHETDPDRSFRLAPNFHGIEKSAEFSMVIDTNSLGLRDVEFPRTKPPGTVRIIGLGDSFTFGAGVNLDQTYLKVLERRLNQQERNETIQVINAGVYGYGTEQEYLQLESLLPLDPDVVLVGFFAGNDVRDAIFGPGHIKVIGGSLFFDERFLKEVKFPQSPDLIRSIYWVLRYCNLCINMGNFYYWHIARNRQSERGELTLVDYETYFLKEPPSEVRQGWETSFEFLTKIQELGEQQGFQAVLVILPSNIQVHDEIWRDRQERYSLEGEDFDRELPNMLLNEFGRRQGMPVIDLLLELRARNAQPLYYEQNQHFNVMGHEAVGGILAEHVSKILEPGLREGHSV